MSLENISSEGVHQVSQLLNSTFSDTCSGLTKKGNDLFRQHPLACIAGAFIAGLSAAIVLYQPSETVELKIAE